MRRMVNPVLVSGIKRRMRGVRTPILMSVYFLLLLGVFALTYSASAGGNLFMGGYYYYGSVPRPGVEGADMLMPLYSLMVMGVLLLVLLLAPALNAGSISSEREKQTLDLLLSSRLSAIRIVMGKILSNLVFIAFLLMLALPFFAVLFLFGSLQPLDILLVYLFMIVTAYACASVGTFFSALMKKTAVATILTYVFLVVFCVATLAGGLYVMALRATQQTYLGEAAPLILRINSLYAVIELVANAAANSGSTGAGLLFGGDASPAALLYSAGFMLIGSPLLNIASALLIKPVQKFQLRAGKDGQTGRAYAMARLAQADTRYPVYPMSPALQQAWQAQPDAPLTQEAQANDEASEPRGQAQGGEQPVP